ncbi:MAG TPA: PfkB family carbohydrate kinase [Pyrinomonadaceae bacterium]|nr:PfkB family carbohydrate kinase [Pyrinomonadaceae bacterium]
MTTERTVLQERLINIVHRFAQRKVLVVGDSVADQFVFGAISRVSREAPVFILKHEHTETTPGGAANCAMNLAALGASVSLVSVAGEDEAGKALSERMQAAGVDCRGLITSPSLQTTTKVRILAGETHSKRQQVIRIDYEGQAPADFRLRRALYESLVDLLGSVDAVIISDYNYGVVNPEIVEAIRDIADSRRIPVLVDSRFQLASYTGFTSATPNEEEVEKLLDTTLTGDELNTAGQELRQKLGHRALLVTRGSRGMTLFEDGVDALELEAVGAREPVDVTGAGDTVIATYTLALASDASFSDAARLANYAGGLVVMKRGTATTNSDELIDSLLR